MANMNSRQIGQKQDKTENEAGADRHFPSSRYFQIHFEHLYELIDDLKRQLEKTNQQVAALQQPADRHIDIQEADTTPLNTVFKPISRPFGASKRRRSS